MDILSILLLFVAACSLGLALIIYFKGRRNPVNVVFAMFCLAALLWPLSIGFFRMANSLTWALFWDRLIYICSILVPPLFLAFAHIFPEDKQQKLKLKVYRLAFYLLPVLILIPLLLLTNLWIRKIELNAQGNSAVLGPVYPFWMFWFIGYMMWAFFILIFKYRRSKGIIRMQLRYFIIAATFPAIGSIPFNLVTPWFGNYKYIWVGPYFIFIMVCIIAYAIIKHRLMDIRVIIRQSTVFVSSGILAIGSGSWVIYWLNRLLVWPDWLENVIGITAAVVMFVPLKKGLQSLANRYLFASLYSYEKTIKELTHKLITILDLKQLAKTIVQEMMKIMRLDKATVLLKNGPTGQVYQIIHLIGFHEENGISLVKDNFLTQWLEKNKRPLVYEELQLMIRDQRSPEIKQHLETLKNNMQRIEANVCLPLLSKDGILGLIVLGSKISGEAYSQQDIELLETLTAQASIAIQNSKLYQEVHDLTHNLQEKVEEQTKSIKKLFRVKTEFLHLVSHQLRTPLTALRGLVSMWAEGVFKDYPEKEKQNIQRRIQLSCERLNNITNDMLDTLDLEESYVRFRFEPVDLIKSIEEVVYLLKPNFDKKGLYLKIIKPDKPLPKIQADKQYLSQVWQNIIDNAEKYTQKGGLIISLSQPDSDQVQVSFKDTGMGLSEEEQAHLFKEKFFRGQEADRIHTAGSGLGLYIVKHIIEGHRGTIEIKSQGKGKGAEFVVRLPILQIG